MNESFGQRNVAIRRHWGKRPASGREASVAEWSRELGIDPKTRRLYNLEAGRFPQGGLAELEEIYRPLHTKGGNPRALAVWAWTGEGVMPDVLSSPNPPTAPRGGVITVVKPAQPVARGSRAEELLEDTIAKALRAETLDEKNRILDGGLRLVREAKQLGLAAIGAVGLTCTLLVGGADASMRHENQLFFSFASPDELEEERRRRLRRGFRVLEGGANAPLAPASEGVIRQA